VYDFLYFVCWLFYGTYTLSSCIEFFSTSSGLSTSSSSSSSFGWLFLSLSMSLTSNFSSSCSSSHASSSLSSAALLRKRLACWCIWTFFLFILFFCVSGLFFLCQDVFCVYFFGCQMNFYRKLEGLHRVSEKVLWYSDVYIEIYITIF
jgi:hypothetical protein